MSQEQAHKSTQDDEQPDDEITGADLSNEELSEEVDDLLDDIDAVLEENAEAMVLGFVQAGGQ